MRSGNASGDTADDTARFSGQFLELVLRRARGRRVVVIGRVGVGVVVVVSLRRVGGERAVCER